MIAVLVPPGEMVVGARLILAEAEAHHLRVRRVAKGTSVRLLDGQGMVGEARLEDDGKGAAVVILHVTTVPRPAGLILLVGVGDRERFEWLVEKSAELGVTDVVPVMAERSLGVASRIRPQQLPKLQVRSREAIKQSGAPWAPALHPMTSVALSVVTGREGTRWLADGRAARAAEPVVGPLTVAIGPEGGFTEEERQVFFAAGFEAVRLGAYTLRFETAAVVAAGLSGVTRGGVDE